MMRAKQCDTRILAVFLVLGMLGRQASGQQTPAQQAPGQPSVGSASTLVEPIVRINHEENSKPTPQLASRITPPQKPPCPFDLTQRSGEHPLQPALRMAEKCLAEIDQRIVDYHAVLFKQERIHGQLGEEQVAFIKVRHKPFAVYMFFLKPCKGREVLYNEGPGGAKGVLVAMDCGWKRRFGKLEFDPEGHMAMNGQKYPIMKLGVRELTRELVEVASSDVNYGECEVKHSQRVMNGRPVTLLEVVHPTPRSNFRFHRVEIFIDNQLRIPVRYSSYLWPEQPGEAPPLEEVYTYLKLKVNNGFTDLDFSKDNPAIFKD